MSRTYVLDANAVLDFVEAGREPNGSRSYSIDASRRRTPLLMSVLNWGEVFYHLMAAARGGHCAADAR